MCEKEFLNYGQAFSYGLDINCAGCVFWLRDTITPDASAKVFGRCRVNPPQVTPFPTEDGKLLYLSQFPITQPTEFCGKFFMEHLESSAPTI